MGVTSLVRKVIAPVKVAGQEAGIVLITTVTTVVVIRYKKVML